MKFHPLIIAFAAFISPASASVTMDWVTVGNPGNAADPRTGYGSVAYEYKIGKYEVTNAQYCAFLNAKGASNSGGIYNSGMSGFGITQSGSSGNFSYIVNGTLANRPVVFVSWFDAARFANWMMNGQGSSEMETGAYTLNGATSGFITANIGAQVYIPSKDEWHKAAYYSAANTSYSLYPNGQSTISKADANYDSSGPTNVGSYNSDASSYGTFDQGGNVWEWNDSVTVGYSHGLRGGSWSSYDGFGLNSSFGHLGPWNVFNSVGFRLASAVPEPTSMLLTMVAGGMMLIRRKR